MLKLTLKAQSEDMNSVAIALIHAALQVMAGVEKFDDDESVREWFSYSIEKVPEYGDKVYDLLKQAYPLLYENGLHNSCESLIDIGVILTGETFSSVREHFEEEVRSDTHR